MGDKSKWQGFQTEHSPVRAGDIDKGASNLLMDWTRLVKTNATLNERPLKESAESYMKDGAFENNEALKKFFFDVILKGLKLAERDKAVEFLMTSFHQGGLMYPVSAPMADLFKNEGDVFMQASSAPKDIDKSVNIVVTERGFKVQEFYSFKRAIVPPDNEDAPYIPKELLHVKTEDDEILPDKGKDYIIKAQATVDVNFLDSASASEPSIALESNNISYGNKAVENICDVRNFGQIIIDFFKRILGLNKVGNLSSEQSGTVSLSSIDEDAAPTISVKH